jgi:hypothetical protein
MGYRAVLKSLWDFGGHEIRDLWALEIDPVSVSGVDWDTQEARTASFGCLVDAWIAEHVLGMVPNGVAASERL